VSNRCIVCWYCPVHSQSYTNMYSRWHCRYTRYQVHKETIHSRRYLNKPQLLLTTHKRKKRTLKTLTRSPLAHHYTTTFTSAVASNELGRSGFQSYAYTGTASAVSQQATQALVLLEKRCLSVCPSVTLWYCIKTHKGSSVIRKGCPEGRLFIRL